eukprot:TRINITY_DN22498_c1_g1_i1.p2 TRINITY_DN22498_c1_g1~~TRINITY_DN22498_c1_g1_i1.p2  ORF type:complete len:130 (-),score=7.64 TRINITY_DN22498_c1_g1_i1:189-578(-)
MRSMFLHDGHSCDGIGKGENCEDLRKIRVRHTLADWGVTEESFQRVTEAIRLRHVRSISKAQLDRIGSSLFEASIASKYEKMVKDYAKVGPDHTPNNTGCRWIPIGWCNPGNKMSSHEGCDSRPSSPGV